MFAKIAYKQNINMWKTNFSLKINNGYQTVFPTKNDFCKWCFNTFFSIILEFRNLKFPELKIGNLKFPELGSFGTWELGNLFKGIPKKKHANVISVSYQN